MLKNHGVKKFSISFIRLKIEMFPPLIEPHFPITSGQNSAGTMGVKIMKINTKNTIAEINIFFDAPIANPQHLVTLNIFSNQNTAYLSH